MKTNRQQQQTIQQQQQITTNKQETFKNTNKKALTATKIKIIRQYNVGQILYQIYAYPPSVTLKSLFT